MATLMVTLTVYSAEALEIVFNPASANITTNSALITFQTNESANSTLTYWAYHTNLTTLLTNTEMINHSYLLTGLNKSTTYNYWFSVMKGNETYVRNNSGTFYEFRTPNASLSNISLNVTIPNYHYSTRLTLEGKTVPNAIVHGYANPQPEEVGLSFYHREVFSDEEGNFVIPDLILNPAIQENIVVIWAMDIDTGETVTKSGIVELDLIPPNVNFVIPGTSRTGNIMINGSTDENVTVTIYSAGYVNGTSPILNSSNIVTNTTVGQNETFSFPVSLIEEKNLVRFEAVDKGGNVVSQDKTVISDTVPPMFEDPTSLEQFTPSYTLDLIIRGKISEQGEIIAYVNGEKQETINTEDDGDFKINVMLHKAQVVQQNATSFDVTYGSFINQTYIDTYPNYVTLKARDKVGNEVDLTGTVVYSPCGFGTWWNINKGQGPYIMPAILSPQTLLDGNAQIALSYKLGWQGSGNYDSVRTEVKVLPMNLLQQEKYDIDWISGSPVTTTSQDGTSAYTLINLKAPDQNEPGEKLTYQEKLKSITSNRAPSKNTPTKADQYDCVTMPKGVGCVKLPLIMEIQFQSDTYNGTQKVCNFVEVAIDNTLFARDYVPDQYIEQMIELMDNLIANINPTVELIQEVEKILIYSFLGLIIADYVTRVIELFKCKFQKNLPGGGSFKTEDYMQDCYQKGGTIQPAGRTINDIGCIDCANAVKSRMKLQIVQAWVGDRLFMPTVPTLQKYVKDNWKNPYSWCYGGNPTSGKSMSNVPDLLPKDYMTMASRTETIKYDNDEAKCGFLHAINIAGDKEQMLDCCGVEYYRKWRSACALLDPIKESACYADQANYALTGKKEISSLPNEEFSNLKCHPVWNAAAGFCDPLGNQNPDYVPTGWAWNPGHAAGTYGDSTAAYFRIVPTTGFNSPLLSGFSGGGSISDAAVGYSLSIGYVGLEPKFEKSGVTPEETGYNLAEWANGEPSPIQAGTVFYPEGGENYEWMGTSFDPALDCKTCLGPNNGPGCGAFDSFTQRVQSLNLIQLPQGTRILTTTHEAQMCTIYNRLRISMSTQNKDYIIDPASAGILRSLQCVALPAIKSYLEKWRNIFTNLRNCFEITLATGDSDPTVCREALSIQVCDAVYDAIKCFATKYSLAFQREDSIGLSFGNVLGAVTGAGADVATGLQDRYGSDTFFQSIFGEDRLANAICIWAFTGEWLFDINAIVDQEFQVPVNSTVLVMPAERRFVSANPLSSPSGKPVYNYKIGISMVAGSDLIFNVDLVCSDDYSCSPVDGYPSGKCDCAERGAPDVRTFPLTIPTSLRSGEAIGIGGRGSVETYQFESPYRYDKVKVTWRWRRDAQGEMQTDEMLVPIKEVGGKPPIQCEWDNSFMMFLCDLGFGEEITTSLVNVIVESPFYLGEKVELRSIIEQSIPEEDIYSCSGTSFCNYSTWLDVSFTNAKDNSQITGSCRLGPQPVPIVIGNDNKRTEVSLPINCVVSPNMFSVSGAGADFPLPKSMVGPGVNIVATDLSQATSESVYIIIGAKKKIGEPKFQICKILPEEYDAGYLLTDLSGRCTDWNGEADSSANILGGSKIKWVGSQQQVWNWPECNSAKIKMRVNDGTTQNFKDISLCGKGAYNDAFNGMEEATASRIIIKQGTGGYGEETWNWVAELRPILKRVDENGRELIVNSPAPAPLAVNGIVQRKTGTLTIMNKPAAEGYRPETISKITVGEITYIIERLKTVEECAASTDLEPMCVVYKSSSLWIYFEKDNKAIAYSNDNGYSRTLFSEKDPSFTSDIGKAAKALEAQVKSEASSTTT